MSYERRVKTDERDRRGQADELRRMGRQLESQRASDIPCEPIAGLNNADGSPVSNVQEALAALATWALP